LLLAAIVPAHADTITMANGDHFSGTIVKSDTKQLTLHTGYDLRANGANAGNGDIELPWSAVKGITSDHPLYVTAGNNTISGTVTTEGADLVVSPASGAPQRIPLDSVSTLRSQTEQTAYERSLNPGVLQNWVASANVGLALARGNSDTTNFNLGFDANRATLHDKIVAFANSIYASNSTPGLIGITGVTANEVRGGARYDHDLSNRTFLFVSADFDHNQLQLLNLQSILSAGAGYHAIKRDDTTLDLFAGANYTRETYATGLQRNLAAVTIGDDFLHKIGKSTALAEHLEFYPDLTNRGQYRFALDASVVTKISKWFGWQTSISDRHISDPVFGTKANDVIFTTGLNVAFTGR